MDGRKIHQNIECPIDNFYISVAHYLNKSFFYPLGFTPNGLTTLSLCAGVLAAWCFHKHWYLSSFLTFIAAYVLDCADGNFARMYHMETTFGDYYDHVADIIKTVLLLSAVAVHPLSWVTKAVFFIVYIVLLSFSLLHMGCQEQNYRKNESVSLSGLKRLCRNHEWIHWTRYLGTGTLYTYVALFILYRRLVS